MSVSDGEVPIFGRAGPHPRSYGTFVRVPGVYVREKHLVTFEDAVRKMTAFPATRLGLSDRGVLRPDGGYRRLRSSARQKTLRRTRSRTEYAEDLL